MKITAQFVGVILVLAMLAGLTYGLVFLDQLHSNHVASDVVEEGKTAGYAGDYRSSCPYVDSRRRRAWLWGFDTASRAAEPIDEAPE